MALSKIYAFALLVVYSLAGCADNSPYVGDGKYEIISTPLLGKDGILITFPDMYIDSSHAESFSIERFPEKGKYLVYLSLGNQHLYKNIAYRLEIYKNGSLIKVLDSDDVQPFEESGTGFHGIYFSSLDSKRESSVEVENFDDKWLFKVEVMQSSEVVPKMKGNILLRMGGRK